MNRRRPSYQFICTYLSRKLRRDYLPQLYYALLLAFQLLFLLFKYPSYLLHLLPKNSQLIKHDSIHFNYFIRCIIQLILWLLWMFFSTHLFWSSFLSNYICNSLSRAPTFYLWFSYIILRPYTASEGKNAPCRVNVSSIPKHLHFQPILGLRQVQQASPRNTLRGWYNSSPLLHNPEFPHLNVATEIPQIGQATVLSKITYVLLYTVHFCASLTPKHYENN